ncbi:unnamed protein product [Lymnaea stagnalis]|uniref:Ig-like domain-containing protein n=1 Tax=Lymnaea stagnalis TaxID=6523 RepID=A0AAV2H7T2_LYMST
MLTMCNVVFSVLLVILTSCSAKVGPPKCGDPKLYTPDDNHVSFVCTSVCVGVYDNQTADCTFQVRNNEDLTNVTGDVEITYTASGNTTFPLFVVTCTLSLLFRDLSPGSYQIQVTVSTNDSALNVTSDWSTSVNLTSPSVYLDNCVTNLSESYHSNYVTCFCTVSSDTEPMGSQRWLKDGQIVQHGGVIDIYYDETLENHTFMCVPVSPLKTGPLPGVMFAPKWPLSPMILGFMLNGTLDGYVMPVNSTANFTCLAINTDISNIVYMKNETGEVISSKVKSFSKVMTSCSDTGIYECRILGSLGQVIVRDTIDVTMECLSLQNESIEARNISAKVGDVVDIDIPVKGYPDPVIYTLSMQLKNGTSNMSQDRYEAVYDRDYPDPTSDEGTVKLRIHRIEATSFTNYTFAMYNEIVTLKYTFRIYEKSAHRDENGMTDIIIGSAVGGSCGLIIVVVVVGLFFKKGYFQKCQGSLTGGFKSMDSNGARSY